MCTSQDMLSSTDASFNGEASSQSSLPDPLVLVNHPMVTRSKSGVMKPNPPYALISLLDLPQEPNNIKVALQHEGWITTMKKESVTPKHNDTWELVPHSSHMNVVGRKWVSKTKIHSDGTLERLKARLVAKGFSQIEGLDYTEIFLSRYKTWQYLYYSINRTDERLGYSPT